MDSAVVPLGAVTPALVPRGGVVPIRVDGDEPAEVNLGDDLDGLDGVRTLSGWRWPSAANLAG